MQAWTHEKRNWKDQHGLTTLGTRLREQRRITQARIQRESGRQLLCRPQGGLNDNLCQIQKSIIHALRFNRQLIIDTNRSGLRDHFDHYFDTVYPFANIKIRLTDKHIQELNGQSCHPSSFTGKLNNYELTYAAEICNFVHSDSGERPCITPHDPPETLLLHDQCGGGQGVQALVYFRFQPRIADEIRARLSLLPKRYKAVHIRHVDVPFDYIEFLATIKPLLNDLNVLVCTDDYRVLRDARQILSDSTIHHVANVPDTQGQKLHDNPGITSQATNIGALCDLIALANAQTIFFPSSSSVYPSGFSRLAIELSNRNDLLRQLLGKKNWDLLQHHR